MTEKQLFQLLKSLDISKVYRDEQVGKLVLEVTTDGVPETLTVSDYKSRHVAALREIDEKKGEIRENKFAAPLEGDFGLGPRNAVKMQFLKRDEQLTAEEKEEKKRLLQELDNESQRHRLIISGMNHLQVHYKEMLPALQAFSGMVPVQPLVKPEGKTLWTKGIKSAALYCLREWRGARLEGTSQLEVAKEFLSHYDIAGENDYTPEQLSNNISQVRLLDQIE